MEQILQIVNDYNDLCSRAEDCFKEYMKENNIKPKFYKGSYGFSAWQFDEEQIRFYDDDFYNGYDLRDIDYKYMPMDYFLNWLGDNCGS